MANKRRGYYTLKLGGKNRTLHFSMNFWSEFTDTLGIPLDKIGEVFEGGISLSAIRALVYSAMYANDMENGNPVEYNLYTVGAWMEDLDAGELEKIVGAMLESKILGNSLNMGIARDQKPSEGK
jgi:hypothetical protein